MWALNNQTPFSAAACWGRSRDGMHEWMVAAKACYDIAPDGRLSLAAEPTELHWLPQYTGEPGLSSLRYDVDLSAPKPTTDIVLNATAYAPGGRPSANFVAGFRVGPVAKRLRVLGTALRGRASFGRVPLLQVPVVYERTHGGHDHSDPDPAKQRFDPRNPIGCTLGSDAVATTPNFEYLEGGDDPRRPAGFGALDSSWAPRRAYAGTYDDLWHRERLPLLPLDWDARTLLCAPPDQQPREHLVGGERVALLNLTPGGALSFELPQVEIECVTRFGRKRQAHRCTVGSVIIEPDAPRVLMVWQSVLACPKAVDELDETILRLVRQQT